MGLAAFQNDGHSSMSGQSGQKDIFVLTKVVYPSFMEVIALSSCVASYVNVHCMLSLMAASDFSCFLALSYSAEEALHLSTEGAFQGKNHCLPLFWAVSRVAAPPT